MILTNQLRAFLFGRETFEVTIKVKVKTSKF